MVDENYSHGWVRVPYTSDGPALQPQINRHAHRLKVGDLVKPNFPDTRERRQHPPGIIRELVDGVALVRWQDVREPRKVDVRYLVKAK